MEELKLEIQCILQVSVFSLWSASSFSSFPPHSGQCAVWTSGKVSSSWLACRSVAGMDMSHTHTYEQTQHAWTAIHVLIFWDGICWHQKYTEYFQFYPIINQQKWHFSSVFLFCAVQQLQGIKYPLLFKWMNENMNEWRRTRGAGGGVCGPLKRRSRPIRVSVSMLCEHWWPGRAEGNTETIETSETNSWLEPVGTAFRGLRPEGEWGDTTHRPRPFVTHLHLPIDSEARLAKNMKLHKIDFYSVVYTCDYIKKKKNHQSTC